MKQKYTRRVAVNMVIANMIGTGIFTTLGFQVTPEFGIPDLFAIMTIWLIGGVVALCGATVYGEIATTVNRSGGEYAFLSEIYHPLLGFVSGWVSMIVGFSAAIAALALAAGKYFLPLIGVGREASMAPKYVGSVMIILVALVHLRGIKFGGRFQNYVTYIKLALVGVFLVIPFIFAGNYESSGADFMPGPKSWETIISLQFAGALVFVFFAYSGWNASTYIVGSLENPKKNLPYSLIVGTIIVTVLYMLLNFVFMYVATFDELAFQEDLGNVVANKILGNKVGLIFSAVFSVALISGLSAMFIAGPRVAQEIGKDYTLFKLLGKQSKDGAPNYAILFMLIISLVMVFVLDFQSLLEFTGLTLAIFSLLTVLGVFVLRIKGKTNENTVRSWGYPITPIIFAVVTLWMTYFFIDMKPAVIYWFLIMIAPGIVLYFVSGRENKT